jgi:hypothetical protein
MLYTEQFSEELYTVIYNDGLLDSIDVKQKLNLLNFPEEHTNYSSLVSSLNNIRDDIEDFLEGIYNKNNSKLKDYLYNLDGLFNLIYLCFNFKKLSQTIKNVEKYVDFKNNKFSNSDPSIISSLDKKIDSETNKMKSIIRRMTTRYLNGLNKLFSIGFDSPIIDIIEPFFDFDVFTANGDRSIKEHQLVKDLSHNKIFSFNKNISEYFSESYFNKLPPEGINYIKRLLKNNQNNKFLNSLLDNVDKLTSKTKKNIVNNSLGKIDYQDQLAYLYAIENDSSDVYYTYI